jgi:pimeloyl-ACP methyl ester carboxylesterase
MNLLSGTLLILSGLVLLLAGCSRIGSHMIERGNPPAGTFAEVNGVRMHYVHVPAPPGGDLPPVVFIHGASGNLNDQMVPVRPLLEGRAEMLFIDRPGHGWSDRGEEKGATPDGQADTIAALMANLGMDSAIIAGHSYGGGIAATFALRHPGRTAGLVFLASATHPWPGGATTWFYNLTNVPVLGPLFSETLALPGGMLRMKAGARCVFAPNLMPEDYIRHAAVALVLRPRAFRANARDVDGLLAHVIEVQPRYRQIRAPTVIISGNRDTVIFEEVHSRGLQRDIPGAELVWIDNLGHKPDWIAPDLTVAAIEKIAGRPVDLAAVARRVERRIAGDAYGPAGPCRDEKPDFSLPVPGR